MDGLNETNKINEKKDVPNSDVDAGGNEDLINYIISLLCDAKVDKEDSLNFSLLNNAEFMRLYAIIMDIRQLTSALNKGDLKEVVKGKGFILANLKALQANLRHLTWQTQKIAEGDFSQKVDFLGEFSESFNTMTSKLKEMTNNLLQMANYDFLTKLPNRLALTNYMRSIFDDAIKNDKNLSILIIDIDYFKKVNDTYGHDVGDRVLMKISEILNNKFRFTDFLGRYGGEEFLVVLPNTDAATAQRRCQDLLQTVKQSKVMIDEETFINLTVSIGVSERKPDDLNYESIVKRSDEALYQAKREGRDRIWVL